MWKKNCNDELHWIALEAKTLYCKILFHYLFEGYFCSFNLRYNTYIKIFVDFQKMPLSKSRKFIIAKSIVNYSFKVYINHIINLL